MSQYNNTLQWCLILAFQEMHLCCCSKHAQLVCLKTLLLFAPSFTQLKIFLQLMKCQLIMEQSWDLFIILFAKVTRQSSVIQSKGLWFYIEYFDPLENHKRNLHPEKVLGGRKVVVESFSQIRMRFVILSQYLWVKGRHQEIKLQKIINMIIYILYLIYQA